MDRERLRAILPLIPGRGRTWLRLGWMANALLAPAYRLRVWTRPPPARGWSRFAGRVARRLARDFIPPFPLPPEVLLHEHAGRRGARCLYLRSEQSWYVHPDTKPRLFLDLLPQILDSVRRGECPQEQRGLSAVDFDAWHSFFHHGATAP